MRSSNPRILIFSLILFVSSGSLFAQTLSMQEIPDSSMHFGLSFHKPFYKDGNWTALSGVYQLYFNVPISSKLNIIGNLPYVNMSYSHDYGYGSYSFSRNGIGNLFIGIQTRSEIENSKRSFFSFGIYFPTADEKVSSYGSFAEYYYFQKYIPDYLGVYFNYAFHKVSDEGFSYGFELGPNLVIPTKDKNSDSELFLHYGIGTGYQINKLLLSAELLGVFVVTEDLENFGDRFIHSLNLGAQWKGEIVSPKIFYKLYLKKDLRDIVDGVLGIGVSVSIDR